MKKPKESTLWNWVIIGFGLLVGVAIVAVMNILNEYMNSVHDESAIAFDSDLQPVSGLFVYYKGKVISIVTGCFIAGAIIKIARPGVNTISLVVVGLIFMVLSIIDLIMYAFPLWYQILSIAVTIPAVLIGNRLIK